MASTFNNTPGVQIKESDAFPLSVVGVNTAIPVFVGETQRTACDAQGTTIDGPVLINTLAEYIEKFGMAAAQKFKVTVSSTSDDQLSPYTIKVEDPATPTDLYYQMQMFYANGGSTCYVYSKGSAAWSDVSNKLATRDDITIVVLPDTFSSDYGAAIDDCAALNRMVILAADYSDINTTSTGFRGKVGTDNLKYSAAYTPYLNTSLSYVTDPAEITLTCADSPLITLNSNGTDQSISLSPTSTNKASEISNTETQLYNQILAAVAKVKVDNLSPTGAMAGVYAKTDRERGVWMAPANVALNNVIQPITDITAEEQGSLNVDPTTGKSINAIRYFPGKGNLVWGARTLDGNSNDWRYISVRRTVSYIEQSLKLALQNYVFESNSDMTWLKVSTMIETFLNDLWVQGGLVGSSAKDAYFVNLGLGTTMTEQDILEGRMIINLGLAVVRPAEFIELNVTQLLQK